MLDKKRTTYCQECSCWFDYPNKARQKSNGKWACMNYINIDNHIGYKRKTHCVRKDVIFGFIKKKGDNNNG